MAETLQKANKARYYLLSLAFMVAAIYFWCHADWEPVFNNLFPFSFFVVLFTIGTFLHIDIGEKSHLSLNDAIAFAAFLAYGPAFAAAAFFVGMVFHILYSRRRLFLRLVLLSVGVVEFFVVGLVYFNLFGGQPGLSGGQNDLLAAFVAGFVIFFFDRFCAFAIMGAAGVQSISKFFAKLKPYAVIVPPLYIWGMAAAFVFRTAGYFFTIAFLLPLFIIYAFFKKEKAYQDTLRETIFSLVKTIDARDSYTAQHSEGVARYARAIAKRLGLADDEAESIYKISLLHDIGKIGIRDEVLLKAGSLSDDEWELMRQHPIIGANLIANLRFLAGSSDACRYHHERWDGKGYPDGLAGEDIPLWSRIIAICDAWDAMRTDRPYRKALPLEVTIEEIKKGSGTQFDPSLVPIALEVFSEQIEFESGEQTAKSGSGTTRTPED